jgi:endonuclease YncB( thermonuclease family)
MADRTYAAVIERVIDGDTFDCVISIDVGFYVTTSLRQRLRLMGSAGGVNAYELHSSDIAIRQLAERGKRKCEELMPPGMAVTIITRKVDSFGRFLARVILPDGRDVGDILLGLGLAVIYRG